MTSGAVAVIYNCILREDTLVRGGGEVGGQGMRARSRKPGTEGRGDHPAGRYGSRRALSSLFLPASLFLLKHFLFVSIIINPLGTHLGEKKSEIIRFLLIEHFCRSEKLSKGCQAESLQTKLVKLQEILINLSLTNL